MLKMKRKFCRSFVIPPGGGGVNWKESLNKERAFARIVNNTFSTKKNSSLGLKFEHNNQIYFREDYRRSM
jgi:hypothetical protein